MNPEDNKLTPMGTQSKETMDKAASVTKDAIRSTQHSVDHAMNKVSDKVDEATSKTAPAMDKVADMANTAMKKARETWHDASGQVRTQTQRASEMASDYAKDEPIKAMLIAAATGACLMGILSMMARSRD